jgi:TonB-linked SusC/RagA family outer membrane protein
MRKFYHFIILLLLMLTLPLSVVFSQKTISGNVTSGDEGLPMIGATVLIKGTSSGTVTDIDGNYSITAMEENATLVFSYTGYSSYEILVGTQTVINVVLDLDIAQLDEVVVVGYGTQKKSDITGAVASVSKTRLEQVPNVNFAQALQGAIPGVTINLNDAGAEGGDLSILVRGRNSIEASNTPLIILDGIPYSGSVSEINPDDIASIEVLKDASAAAIYGSRGSNGVILISTKKGEIGKPSINYSGYYGIQKIANIPRVLTGPEFFDFKTLRNPDQITDSERAIYNNGTFTDWADETTRTGQKQQHTMSVSGGTEKMRYFVSGTFLDVTGIAEGDDFQRYTTRLNLEANVADWLTIGTNTQLSLADRSGFTPSWSGGIDGAFYMNPLTTIRDEAGKLSIYPWPEDIYWGNPLQHTLAENKDNRYKVFSNNYVNVDIPWIPGLKYRLNTGVEYANRERNTYYGRNTKNGLEDGGSSDIRNRVDNNYIVENILSYNKAFGKHNVFVTALYSYQKDSWEEHRTEAQGFPNDVLTWHQAATANLVTPSSGFQREDLLSQMLRVNYSFNSRYLITLTGRRDGFSGFGTNRKWGFFPSVALGWNISNESFLNDVQFLDQLKLRVSYGENGNQAVGPYETLARLSEFSYLDGSSTAPGYIPSKLGNPDLGWETTKSFNIGLDFAFLKGRVSGSLDFFNADTYDLLLDRSISSVHGITSITENIGETSNKGIELALTTYNISSPNLKWTTSATVSYIKNEIVSLYGILDDEGNETDDVLNRWFIGQPIRVNFGKLFDGVFQTGDEIGTSAQPDARPGDAKVKDINEDGKIDDQDRVINGQLDPKYIWGLTNTLQYRDFSLTVFIHGANGVTRRNTLLNDDVWSSRRNTTLKNWWSPENPTNEFYANAENANPDGAQFYEKADFIRLKDISLAYDLPLSFQKKIGVEKLRVYVAGRNLATITKFEGLDPELNNDRDVPLQKEYLVGLILGF